MQHALAFAPFKACTVPRPVGWITAASTTGIANLAPRSQGQNLSIDPPMVRFAASQSADGRRKHRVIDAEERGWFAWNTVPWLEGKA